MAVREIRLFGDPILKTVSQPITEITDSVRSLVVDLEQTTAITGRAGVASNQIGVDLRAFGYHVEGVVGHFINPEIIEQSGELIEVDEGCLSLPEIWSKTPRYSKVVIRGQKVTGEVVQQEAEGLLAQVFQHEVDHLNGLVYLDRLEASARKVCMAALRETTWFMRD
jgi:peptide deformylase